MCDYCGCRDRSPIDDLAKEHERVLDLGYQLRRLAREGAHREAAAILEHDFVPLLAHHTAKEERGLFTQLRASWEADDRLDALVDEHRAMEAQLAIVALGAPGWEDVLVALVADLAEHVLSEETDLFPYALYELSADQWQAVEDVHAGADVPVG